MGGAIALGLLALAVALVVVLSGSPLVVAQTNGALAFGSIWQAKGDARVCQSHEVLPAETSAIRLTLLAAVGPQVTAAVLSGNRVLTSGVTGSGWTSGAVTVPVKPFPHPVANVSVCFKLGPAAERVELGGEATTPAAAALNLNTGLPLSGRFTVEYMKPGESSWWSSRQLTARRLGLGRAPSGSWIALLLLALMGASIVAAIWRLLKDLG